MSEEVKKPHNGIWGDDDVWKAYADLKKEVDELIPNHIVGLHITGAAATCRAKAKMLVAKAKILEDFVKASCRGR